MMNLTREQVEAMSVDEITEVREQLTKTLQDLLCEIGATNNIDPITAARRLAMALPVHAANNGWTEDQLARALSYLAAVGRELQQRFDTLLSAMVDPGVEVWCHYTHVPALYMADSGCAACHCDGVHTTLVDATVDCTHGADCPSHPGVTGPHNYDRS